MDTQPQYVKPKSILPQLFQPGVLTNKSNIPTINELRMEFVIKSPFESSHQGKMLPIKEGDIVDVFHGPCIGNSSFVKLVGADGKHYNARNPYDNPFSQIQSSYPLITNFTHSSPDSLTEYEKTFLDKMLSIDGKIKQQLGEVFIQIPTTQYRLYLYYGYVSGKIDKKLYEDYMKFLDQKVYAYKTAITNVLSDFNPKKITFYEREKEGTYHPGLLLDQQSSQKDPDSLRQMIHTSYQEGHYQLAQNPHTTQVIIQDAGEKVQLQNLDSNRLKKPILGIYGSHKHLVPEGSTGHYPQNFYFTK